MQDTREVCPYWDEKREALNDRRCECRGPIECYPIGGAAEEMYKGGISERRESYAASKQKIW